jgi:hypothetical protein
VSIFLADRAPKRGVSKLHRQDFHCTRRGVDVVGFYDHAAQRGLQVELWRANGITARPATPDLAWFTHQCADRMQSRRFCAGAGQASKRAAVMKGAPRISLIFCQWGKHPTCLGNGRSSDSPKYLRTGWAVSNWRFRFGNQPRRDCVGAARLVSPQAKELHSALAVSPSVARNRSRPKMHRRRWRA